MELSALLQFFKRYLQGKWHQQLTELAVDPYEKRLIQAFDFMNWVDTKIRKVPFSQVSPSLTALIAF